MAVANTYQPGQSAPIDGVPRNTKVISVDQKLCTIYDEDGNPVQKPRHVASDYVRSRGYSFARPQGSKAPVNLIGGPGEPVKTVADGDETDAPEAGVDPVEDTAPTDTDLALTHLETLRDVATKLGITVDNRWGIKRLNTEIAAAEKAPVK